ncbi:serine/threonine protein kinase [Sphaerisporangium perillae]|uniref:serine/threonine protein kinase n=1 Tax=Sphaerisporangium perillae TaxID=2935860 RepID=UPI00200DDB68|nr:serine/threonine-protein kinase [Sphaerisporangium perillae]
MTGRIGEGGQGVVYAADAESGGRVAVKLLHRRFSDEEQARRSFGVEMRRAQRVTGPRVARILAYGVHDGRLYYAAEYVNGPSLWEVVEKQGPRSGDALTEIAIATLTGLTAIHQAGMAHGDFRPESVLLGPQGPQVIDFAVGRVLDAPPATGGPPGASPFVAPEHLAGTIPGPQSDMFAWAGTIVYAATGRAPFGQDSVPAVINRILNGVPDLSALSGALLDSVTACLDRVPARRPEARELLARMEGVQLGFGPAPRIPPAGFGPGPQTPPAGFGPVPQIPPATAGPAWPGPPPPRPATPPTYQGPIPLSSRPLWPGPREGASSQAPPGSPAPGAGPALPPPGTDGPTASPDVGRAGSQARGRPTLPRSAASAVPGTGSASAARGTGPSAVPPEPFPGTDRHALTSLRRRRRRNRALVAGAGVVTLAAAVALVSSATGGAKKESPGVALPPTPAPGVTATTPAASPPLTEPTPVPSPSKTKEKPTKEPAPIPRASPTRTVKPLLQVSPSKIRVNSDYISYVNIKLRAPGAAVSWRATITEGGILSSSKGRIQAGSSATITAYGTPYCSTSKVRFTSNGGSRTVTIIWGGILC